MLLRQSKNRGVVVRVCHPGWVWLMELPPNTSEFQVDLVLPSQAPAVRIRWILEGIQLAIQDLTLRLRTRGDELAAARRMGHLRVWERHNVHLSTGAALLLGAPIVKGDDRLLGALLPLCLDAQAPQRLG